MCIILVVLVELKGNISSNKEPKSMPLSNFDKDFLPMFFFLSYRFKIPLLSRSGLSGSVTDSLRFKSQTYS